MPTRRPAPEPRSAMKRLTRLAFRHLAHATTFHQLCQVDAAEKIVNLLAQVVPQVMGQAAGLALAVLHAATAGGIHGLVDGTDHVHHGDIHRRAAEPVATPGTPGALHQSALAQLGKQLLQVRERDALAPGYVGEGYGPLIVVDGQIQHGRDRVPALGGQSHRVAYARELPESVHS